MNFLGSYTVQHWKKGEDIQNYGDFLSQYLHENHLGDRVDKTCDIYHLIGSVISDPYIKKAKRKLKKIGYWSCGARDYFSVSTKNMKIPKFFGVRGYLSSKMLNLNAGSVVGDSAFLLPFMLPDINPSNDNGNVLIPHFSDLRADETLLSLYGGDRVLRTNIPNNFDAVEEFTKDLASAKFILTSSLHGAILAYTYGIPFAVLNAGAIDCPFKWVDFMSTTGLETRFVVNLDEGLKYSKDAVIKEKYFNISPLIKTCPFLVNLKREKLNFSSPLYL